MHESKHVYDIFLDSKISLQLKTLNCKIQNALTKYTIW